MAEIVSPSMEETDSTDKGKEKATQKTTKRTYPQMMDDAINDRLPPVVDPGKCGNCGQTNHRAAVCVDPSRSGWMEACPKCDSKDHMYDGCPSRDPRQDFDYLIFNRQRKPPVKTRMSLSKVIRRELSAYSPFYARVEFNESPSKWQYPAPTNPTKEAAGRKPDPMRVYSSFRPLQLLDAAEFALEYTGVGWRPADDSYKKYFHIDKERRYRHRKRSPREKDQMEELHSFAQQVAAITEVNKKNIQTYANYIMDELAQDSDDEYELDDESNDEADDESDKSSEEYVQGDFEDDTEIDSQDEDDIEDDAVPDSKSEDSVAEQKRREELRREGHKQIARQRDQTFLFTPLAVRKEAARVARGAMEAEYARQKEKNQREHESNRYNKSFMKEFNIAWRRMQKQRRSEKKAEMKAAKEESHQEDVTLDRGG
ncbi:hypothetical protein GGR57DRAFT_513948 [Xylariaceae sp. FL1272]|nr:hypothetical protein GGR57DRAFT_513948 [Xylariaceae sp. FL1272]